jgi:hypothetical protein
VSERVKVRRIVQTCFACPSQWEGHLDDGRMIYVRYRWGWLTVSVSDEPTTDVFDAVDGTEIHEAQMGHEYDGDLTTAEMMQATLAVVDWAVAVEPTP